MDEKEYTFPELISKAENYCAWAERCQFDVARKLKQWGADHDQSDRIIVHLIENNFLNELRYAKAFTNDSYRLKQWGKIKIAQKLKSKFISEYSIKKSLSAIDEDQYKDNAQQIAVSKWALTKGNQWEKRTKVARHLNSKGYEFELIQYILVKLMD